MLFSLSLPVLRDPSARDPYRQTFELARIAEESGFDTATVGHHHFMPGNMSDPLTFLHPTPDGYGAYRDAVLAALS